MRYDKMEVNKYADFFKQSKHVRVQEDFIKEIERLLERSPYTKGELAERLGWDMDTLNLILADRGTLDFYEAVHLAGALGYKIEVSIKKCRDE